MPTTPTEVAQYPCSCEPRCPSCTTFGITKPRIQPDGQTNDSYLSYQTHHNRFVSLHNMEVTPERPCSKVSFAAERRQISIRPISHLFTLSRHLYERRNFKELRCRGFVVRKATLSTVQTNARLDPKTINRIHRPWRQKT